MPPKTLSHYCDTTAFFSILKNRSIWLSSLSQSNDRLEGRWILTLFAEACRRADIKEDMIDKFCRDIASLLDNSDPLGFCLSEESDLLSQWRGYADDGTGFSIGFAFPFLSRGYRPETGSGWTLNQVEYGNRNEPTLVEEVIAKLKVSIEDGVWSEPGLFSILQSNGEKVDHLSGRVKAGIPLLLLLFEAFKFKNPAFAEEREWRLISYSLRGISDDREYRVSGDKLVGYREFEFPEIDDSPIRSVTLGPRNRSNIEDVREFVSKCGFCGVEIISSEASYR